MEIFKLFGSILVDNSEADKSISKTEKKAEGLSTRLGKGIKTAAKWSAGLVAGAGAIGVGMFAMAKSAGETADRLLDLNSITGMSTDEIQKWQKASVVAGVDSEAMTKAAEKLTKSLAAMDSPTSKGADSLKKLGLSVSEISSMSADERMDVLSQALAGVEDKTERARLGTDLFGGAWKDIAPIMDLGAEGMQKAKDSANIVSNEDLVKANNFRIAWDSLKDTAGKLALQIGANLAPIFTGFSDYIMANMPTIQSVTKQAFDIAGVAIKKVSDFVTINIIPAFKTFVEFIRSNMPEIQATLKTALDIAATAFDGLKKAIKFVIDNMNILLPIIIGVTAAVLAQMVINGLVTAYKTWQTVTKTQTTLQWLLNAALNANPLGLVAIAIGAVIAAGVLLYKNWDTVKSKLGVLWDYMKKIGGNIKSFFGDVFGGLVSGFKWYVNKWISALNFLIRGLNKIKVSIPDWVPGFGGKSFGINLSQIPAYAIGTNNAKGGLSLVGERGPELMNVPKGSKIHTADETSSLLGGVSRDLVNAIIDLASRPIQVSMSNRVVAQELAPEMAVELRRFKDGR